MNSEKIEEYQLMKGNGLQDSCENNHDVWFRDSSNRQKTGGGADFYINAFYKELTSVS